ncbi:Pentatricopeptide repeat-containing protein At5g48730, chloroplastic [Linum perenne]
MAATSPLSSTPNPIPRHQTQPNPASERILAIPIPNKHRPEPSLLDPSRSANGVQRSQQRAMEELEKAKKREAKERKEEKNRKTGSRKAISVILRREATKAIIETKNKGGKISTKRLLPRTVLEALHERITGLRWESALKVFELLREQLWYKPYPGVYVKMISMLGKCRQAEKAQELFQVMIDEGCAPCLESYTALVSAYGRSGIFDKAFSLLEEMKTIPDCYPDVHTYSILIKSCLQVFAFEKVQVLLSDMAASRIRPSVVTFEEMEATLVKMLSEKNCDPDVWTMNSAMRAFGGSGQIEMMEKCYDKFQSSGIEPNIKTFNILLDSYGKSGEYQKMSAVMEYMQKYHYSWTIVTYNVVIDAFGRAGDLKQMEYMFRLMRTEKIKPSCVTLCSLVRAYGQARKPEKISGVLRFVENSDVMLDTVFFNCLVDVYGKLECFVEMKEVIEWMEERGCKADVVTYRTMIKAYRDKGMSSHVKRVQELLRSVEVNRIPKKRPDF